MSERIERLQELLRSLDADAFWITSLPDIRWACGFSGSNGLLIVLRDACHFLSDGRYAEQARREVHGARIHIPGYDLVGRVADEQLVADPSVIIFQSDHLTITALDELTGRIPGATWRGESMLLAGLVAEKSDAEIARITRAQRLTEAVFADVLEWIRPGLSEKEVAAEIVYRHLKMGADGMSFDPVVAFGPNSALPHVRPSDRVLESGDVVLLDIGCFVDGYASDMTRTFAVGQPDDEVRKVYEIVLEAQRRAIDRARSGMPSNELDSVAREVIREAGYGDAFTHSLGHGVGLQIHEWPRVSYSSEDPLPDRCVVSIEPGIYLPGRFGIRIEDLVVLREHGADRITRAPRSWRVL